MQRILDAATPHGARHSGSRRSPRRGERGCRRREEDGEERESKEEEEATVIA